MQKFEEANTFTSGTYPDTVSVNSSNPETPDGTPFTKKYIDEFWGFAQAAVSQGAVTPSGDQDTASVSQILEGIKNVCFANTKANITQEWTGSVNQVPPIAGDTQEWYLFEFNGQYTLTFDTMSPEPASKTSAFFPTIELSGLHSDQLPADPEVGIWAAVILEKNGIQEPGIGHLRSEGTAPSVNSIIELFDNSMTPVTDGYSLVSNSFKWIKVTP